MLGLPPSGRIYFATELSDMRNGIDGLRARVESALRHDPYEGHLFVFVGESEDKVKVLFWDRSGFVLQLTDRHFRVPRTERLGEARPSRPPRRFRFVVLATPHASRRVRRWRRRRPASSARRARSPPVHT